jgi:hypothetical protein
MHAREEIAIKDSEINEFRSIMLRIGETNLEIRN